MNLYIIKKCVYNLYKQKITMDNPYYGIKLYAKLWHTMTSFSKDCVVLVLADDYYKEDDYIRDYDKFLEYINKND